MEETVRLSGIVRESIVDGPGIRFVVFTQGCPHHCKGCHNPETHDFSGGFVCTHARILQEIEKNPLLKGVTFSGGEPFAQAQSLAVLGGKIKKIGLQLMVYTGYTFEQLQQNDDAGVHALLEQTDLLVDGPFVLGQRDLTLRFRGSRNQRLLDVPASLEAGRAISLKD